MWQKNNIFSFYYKTAYVLYFALYFILIERSEVKLRLFLKNPLRGGKYEKIASEIKISFAKENSVFLRKFVLRNFITMHCIRT